MTPGPQGQREDAAEDARAEDATGDEPASDSSHDSGASPAEARPVVPSSKLGLRFGLGPYFDASVRFLVLLTILALATRLVWVMWVHPPGNYIFSDMAKYVDRAQKLAVEGFTSGDRTLAWQTWGTHYILAIPFRLFGPENYRAAAAFWAVMGAAAVPVGYLLACRVCTRHLHAKVVGVILLLWHPNLSNTGYFLSETPFLLFQLWSTYWLVVVLQDGRRAVGAGVVSAVAFAVRPQSALFFLLVLLTWLVNRARLPQVRVKHLVAIAIPLLLTLAFSFWRFHEHTGYWKGIAENANMNLTAGRCHNIVTQAFPTERHKLISERRGETRSGRRVSLPGYRTLSHTFPDSHPLGLRPALRSETIRFVGYIGDPDIHEDIRKECYARTGFWGQAQYSVTNAMLLWFIGKQWPEMEKGREKFLPVIEFYKYLFQIVFWLPSMIGAVLSVIWIRKRPALTFVGWQLVTSITIAAIFFGTIRLRTPYDPYAIILAVEVWALVLGLVWTRLRGRKDARPETT